METKDEEEEQAFNLGVQVFDKMDPEQEGFVQRSKLAQIPDLCGVSLSMNDRETMVNELLDAAPEPAGKAQREVKVRTATFTSVSY